jgi:hypothetical protein
VRMKELQSQKARIVAQMVPVQASHASESPFEDTENVPTSVPVIAQGERRVRVRTREAVPVVGKTSWKLLSRGRERNLTNRGCYFWSRVFQRRYNSNFRAA